MKRRAMLIAVLAAAVGHAFVLLTNHNALRLSNAFQIVLPLFTVMLCLHEAQYSPSLFFRRLWRQLAFAFLIWTVAQIWYFVYILGGHEPPFPSLADFLWMLFAFPIFLVASNTQETTQDWVAWLDIGQACISVSILYVLMFAKPALISIAAAYDVQGIALFLASALRYSIAVAGRERVFFRNLTSYLAVYAVCSAVAEAGFKPLGPSGDIVDITWTIPFVVFCVLALRVDRKALNAPQGPPTGAFRTRLHGIGAFSLALISIGAGGFLAIHRPALGMLALTFAFILFAARTSLREMQLHAAHSQLEQAYLHDALTGLANRTLLLRELARCLAKRGVETDRDFAVLFVDLDRFKIINDSLGHAYGDQLLLQAASVIRSVVRPADIIARLGGDEFVILLEDLPDDEFARGIATRIISGLQLPLTLEGRVTYLNACIGIVLGSQAASGDEMLRNADCAMYEAKAQGTGRARFFTSAMLTKANEALLLETDLRQSLNDGAVSVWYQPVYSVSGNSIYAFEALARWRHPLRGLVPPAQFIPIAEDTGLIIELGKQVLKMACLQVGNWNALHHLNMGLSVNFSARQFADPNLFEDIMNIVRTTRFDPRLLKLEITESVLIGGMDTVKKVLEAARAAGIEIYLDDFGTGYSSLSYLLDFPFDTVKIDRSFVRHLERDERRAEVVRMIIQLTANLKKKVIAEGIETVGELERVTELGCDLIQGYLISRPLAPDIMSRLLAESPVRFLHDYERAVTLAMSLSTAPAISRTPVSLMEEPLEIG